MAMSIAILLARFVYVDLKEEITPSDWDGLFIAVVVGVSAVYCALLAVSPNNRINQFKTELRHPIRLGRAVLGLFFGFAALIVALLLPEPLRGYFYPALFVVFSSLAVFDWLRRRANRDDTKSAIP